MPLSGFDKNEEARMNRRIKAYYAMIVLLALQAALLIYATLR
jgi:hypothetical protein